MDPLRQAARDLRQFLALGYPRQACLSLVGDRHGLDADQRHLLRRGVFAPAKAQARRARLLGPDQVAGQPWGLDGHNLLITLETALKGGTLVLADDGVMRDIAGRGRAFRPGPATQAALELLMGALAPAAAVFIYLDAPLSGSGQLAAHLRRELAARGLTGDAQAVPVPERQLVIHPGPVASSDSALLDQVAQPFDLAGRIIRGLTPPPAWEELS